jgi:hypothetical protein
VKQIHRKELEGGDKERPSAFPKIRLKETDSGIQRLDGERERTTGSATPSRQSHSACKPYAVLTSSSDARKWFADSSMACRIYLFVQASESAGPRESSTINRLITVPKDERH